MNSFGLGMLACLTAMVGCVCLVGWLWYKDDHDDDRTDDWYG